MPTAVESPAAPRAIGPYSQAVLVEGPAGRTLFCSGQIPLDPTTGELVPGDAAVQTERIMGNVEAVLSAAGMAFADVVRTTVYLVQLDDFAAVNQAYGRRFAGPFPARSTVQVAALPRGARVEIEVLAVQARPGRAGRRPGGGSAHGPARSRRGAGPVPSRRRPRGR
jgi:2-iminobutanoate/2-iminopropanoate deaminase